jgi:aldehyde dehydrogenase (NAD+)
MQTTTDSRIDIQQLFATQKKKSLELRTEPLQARKARLQHLRNWIKDNRTTIQQAIYNDFKKPAGEVDGTEIFHVLAEIKLAVQKLDQWAAPKKVDAPLTFLGTRSYLKAEPRGACLIIAPWNYPFSLALGPLVSALAAGNTAVIKPSEMTPHTSALIAAMAAAVFDESVVAVVQGDAEVSKTLTALPFDHIFFTGSPAVGKLIMKAAAEHLTSVTLELGGKSPALVTANARIEDAAERLAVAKFINCGQTCIAPDYVLVDEKVADKFTEALKQQIQKHFTEKGTTLRQSSHYARLVNTKHWLRINALLQEVVQQGASIEYGGEVDQHDRFFHPTLITQVPTTSRIMDEEIFGPVLPIITYSGLREAIHLVNSKAKPLALYIFTQSSTDQQQIISNTSSGAVCINESAAHFLNNHLPFGGVNNSGMGSTHGYYGFAAFSHLKPVLKQRNGLTTLTPLYPPYTTLGKRLMNALLKMF